MGAEHKGANGQEKVSQPRRALQRKGMGDRVLDRMVLYMRRRFNPVTLGMLYTLSHPCPRLVLFSTQEIFYPESHTREEGRTAKVCEHPLGFALH